MPNFSFLLAPHHPAPAVMNPLLTDFCQQLFLFSVKPMSLEMSFMEEIQSLHMEGMGETGPQMEIPLQTPVVEVTHKEGVKNLLPKPIGKLIF